MKTSTRCFVVIMASCVTLLPVLCFGISAEALKNMLDQGVKVTIIDVRSGSDYSAGHIPNAIHIPPEIVEMKTFPPLGKVVVYGDGINRAKTEEVVSALNKKPGIQAQILDGGFLAWEDLQYSSTGGGGVKREKFLYMTYQELLQMMDDNGNIVLVDVRGAGAGKKERDRAAVPIAEPLDLSRQFPGREIITWSSSSHSRDPLSGAEGGSRDSVYVLIDRGDGGAEKAARRLHSAGMKRIAILMGGERSLEREGRPGLKTQTTGD